MNCVLIPGETGSTYTLTGDDVGHEVRVSVEATNGAGSAQAASAPAGGRRRRRPAALASAARDLRPRRGRRDARPPAPAAGPARSRSPSPTSGSAATPAAPNCTDIAGATGSSYTLTAADVGGTVRVEVTAHATPRVTTRAPRPPTARSPPRRRSARRRPPSPARRVDGQTLTADPGAFSGTAPVDLRLPVAALRRRRHELRRHRRRHRRAPTTSCPPTSAPRSSSSSPPTNAAGSDTRPRPPRPRSLPLAPANVAAAGDPGDPLDGQHADRRPGHLDRHTPIAYAYQWQRCDEDGTNCADILGATGPTYTLVPGDIDHVLRVDVTASNARRQRAERLRADRRRRRPPRRPTRPSRPSRARSRTARR